jgi:hypothetical protein
VRNKLENNRNKGVNEYGCIPNEDVCLKHDEPLVCDHGCSCAKPHTCAELEEHVGDLE